MATANFAESRLPFLLTLANYVPVRAKIMAASDIYVRVHEVFFGPNPDRNVLDFMQRLDFLSRQQ